METKFTKGKWYWLWDDCGCEMHCSCGKHAYSLRSELSNTESTITSTPVIYSAEDLSSPDAHLIAAAPEMYEALYGLYYGAAITGDDSEWVDDIGAILAKARGE